MIALSVPPPAYPLRLLMIVSLLKPLPGIYLPKWSIKSVFTYLLLPKKRLPHARRNLLYFLDFIARHFNCNDSFTVQFFLLLWEVTCRELFPIAFVFLDVWVIPCPSDLPNQYNLFIFHFPTHKPLTCQLLCMEMRNNDFGNYLFKVFCNSCSFQITF